MLGRKVVEGQQRLPVFRQAVDRLRVLHLVGLEEEVESLLRILPRRGQVDLVQALFRTIGAPLRLLRPRQAVQHVGGLVHPAPLWRVEL